jgi:GAF domain-containing protein
VPCFAGIQHFKTSLVHGPESACIHGPYESVLAPETIVDRRLIDSGSRCNRAEGCSRESSFAKQLLGGIQNAAFCNIPKASFHEFAILHEFQITISYMPASSLALAEETYRVLLQASKAANSELEFAGVLKALASVLSPILPVDVIAVVTVYGESVRARTVYVAGAQMIRGETAQGAATSLRSISNNRPPSSYPLAGSGVEHVGRTRRALVREDVEVEHAFPEDDRLLSHGLRSYVRCPLIVREELIGTIAFCHFAPRRYNAEEVALLEDVSAVIATAVSNSLAFAEIRALKDQLHAENLLLKQEIGQTAMFEEIVGSSVSVRRVLTANQSGKIWGCSMASCGSTVKRICLCGNGESWPGFHPCS